MQNSEERDPKGTAPQEPNDVVPASAAEGTFGKPEIGEDSSSTGLHSTPASQMTVVDFIEHKFAPGHINLKRYPSRLFYQAILKHVIPPEEVERIFQMNSADPRKTLKAIDGWPYLHQMKLCDVRHEHVSEIASTAKAHGYSDQTVRHIRNVIGTIFSHAIQERCFFGDNPISLIAPTQRSRKQDDILTPEMAKAALSMMKYPERELTLIGALADMTPAEIIGLQWGHINMLEEERVRNEMRIPPMTIAVRKRWYRGELDDVTRKSFRDVAIDRHLLQILMELRVRSLFIKPTDFVLVSQFGTPISHDNIMTQRLRPIARLLGIPSVSSRVFHQIQDVLKSELDKSSPFRSFFSDQSIDPTFCEV